MLKIERFISTLFAAATFTCIASAQYSVRGEVIDSTGTGEPYATIRIYLATDTTRAVTMGVTAEDGTFNQALSRAGSYRLSVASVGKQEIRRNFEVSDANRHVDLGRMVARVADNVLGEVEVVAQKPLVSAEIDRLSYDVASDEDAKASSILEMLKKVPMVTVDGQDNIRVNGSSDFKIYKNGHPDNTLSGNPSQVLKSIPADMVEKIEVITEPGAKYDAEGVNGILNIVMKDNSRIDGIMGSLYAQYNTLGQPGGNLYLTTSLNDKLTASVNYSYVNVGGNIEQYQDHSFTYKETGSNEASNMTMINRGHLHFASLDLSYEIDTLNLVTASFSGYALNIDPTGANSVRMSDAAGSPMYSYVQDFGNGTRYDYFNMSGRFDYQHLTQLKGEALNFSYMLSSSGTGTTYDSPFKFQGNPPISYDYYLYDSDQKMWEHTFQLDYTRPFGDKHKLDVGAKYIFRRNHSASNTRQDEQPPVPLDFMHRTHVGAVYGEYSFTSGPWMARAGLRYEFARMTADYRTGSSPFMGKNLNDLVPTLSVGYRLDEKNNLRLNFSTRINRPGISYLDPTVNESPTEVKQGNPSLASARNHSLQATYTYIHPKLTLNATAGGLLSNDQITQLIYTDGDTRHETYGNIGRQRSGWLNLFAQWMPSKKTNVSVNTSVTYNCYQNTSLGLDNSRWDVSFFARASQELPWKLRLSLSGGRNGGGIPGLYSYIRPTHFYMLGLQRSFLKDDRLTVQLFAMNPFSGKYQKNETVTRYGDYTGWTKAYYPQRMFQVAVSFTFGSLKASVKKTRTTITNDDVVGGGRDNAPATGTSPTGN